MPPDLLGILPTVPAGLVTFLTMAYILAVNAQVIAVPLI